MKFDLTAKQNASLKVNVMNDIVAFYKTGVMKFL